MTWKRLNNTCAICGAELTPYSEATFTEHEFECYRANPERIPPRDLEIYQGVVTALERYRGKA